MAMDGAFESLGTVSKYADDVADLADGTFGSVYKKKIASESSEYVDDIVRNTDVKQPKNTDVVEEITDNLDDVVDELNDEITSFADLMTPEEAARYKDWNVQKIREVSIHNSESDTMTLGKFEPSINSDGTENWSIAGERSYNTIAQNNGDMYFDMKDGLYEEIQTRYNISSNEMFEKFNIPAINKAIEENKIIRFSHNPNLNKYKNSYMYLEWSYLKNECQYTHLIQKGEYWYAVK